jgi:hypothetical protein
MHSTNYSLYSNDSFHFHIVCSNECRLVTCTVYVALVDFFTCTVYVALTDDASLAVNVALRKVVSLAVM